MRREQPASETRSTRFLIVIAWLVSSVWLVALLQPVGLALSSRSTGHIILSLVGVVLFLTIYLWATGADAHEFAMMTPQTPEPLWRRALPALLITALAFAMTLGLNLAWDTLFIFAVVTAARRLPIQPALIAIAILSLIPFSGALTQGTLSLATALQNASLIAVVGITVIGMRWSFMTNRDLRLARRELVRLAITEERLRFARDLHDLLGHTLSLIALKSELARRLADTAPERTQAELTDIEHAARQALSDVRAAVAGYRQTTLAGELAAARDLLAAAGVALDTQTENVQLPAPVESALAWAVREGVTNISGARACSINLSTHDGWIALQIEDDGKSGQSDPATTHNGLRGLTERVIGLGGQIQAGPDHVGYVLRVSLPISREPNEPAMGGDMDVGKREVAL